MTELTANNLLNNIQDKFVKKFSKSIGFKYLALRRRKNNFFLELAHSSQMSQKKVNEIKKFIEIEFSNTIEVISFQYQKRGREKMLYLDKKLKSRLKSKSSLKLKPKVFEGDFTFSNGMREISGGVIERPRDSQKPGTLGGIISLKNHKGLYLVSNYHVIMGNGNLDDKVYGKNGEVLGTLFWGMFSDKYDIAIAKASSLYKPKSGLANFKLGKLSLPSFKKSKLSSFGLFGPEESKIYSINAIVNIENQIFKNQILFTDSGLKGGDSGTFIVQGNGKVRDVIGLYIGGETQRGYKSIKIANKFYNLFSKPIGKFTDHRQRVMPEIIFKSYY